MSRVSAVPQTESGAMRYARNRRAGVVDKAIALHGGPENNDAMAKAAEDYFADRFGLRRSRNDRPTDFEFIVGKASIDVKWTPYEHGYLIHTMSSKTRATFYVLVIGATVPAFWSPGWAWGKDLHASIVGPPRFKVACYGLRQDQLHTNLDLQMATLGLVAQ